MIQEIYAVDSVKRRSGVFCFLLPPGQEIDIQKTTIPVNFVTLR